MPDQPKKREIELIDFLGTGKTYWHGNSLRAALPDEIVDIFKIVRERGFAEKGDQEVKRAKFAFYLTNKGILMSYIDDDMNKKFRDALSFTGEISDKDIRFLFERGIFP